MGNKEDVAALCGRANKKGFITALVVVVALLSPILYLAQPKAGMFEFPTPPPPALGPKVPGLVVIAGIVRDDIAALPRMVGIIEAMGEVFEDYR